MKSKILLFCIVISLFINISNGYSEQPNKSTTKQFGEFVLLNGERIIGKFEPNLIFLKHIPNNEETIYFLISPQNIKSISRISDDISGTSKIIKFKVEVEKTNIITVEIKNNDFNNSIDKTTLFNELKKYYYQPIDDHPVFSNGLMLASLQEFFDPYSTKGGLFHPNIQLKAKKIMLMCGHYLDTSFKLGVSFCLENSLKIIRENGNAITLPSNQLLTYISGSENLNNNSDHFANKNISLNIKFTDEMFVVIQKNESGEIESRGFGKIKIQRGKPQLWNAGQFVFFRCDARIEGQMGKSGLIYQLDDNLYLKQVGSFDLNLSNDEIQKQLLNDNSNRYDNKTLIDLTNLSTFKYGPRIKSATLKRAYQIGSYFAYLFEEIESTTSMKYLFIMAIVKSGEKEPCFLISSEANAFKIGGSHYLCYFDGERHGNLGGSDNWANIKLFTEKALSFTIEHFNISDSPQEIPLNH